MKIFGLCGKTIEDLIELNPNTTIKFVTVFEFIKILGEKSDSPVCIVDNPSRLSAMNELKIVDLQKEHDCYKLKKFNYQNLERLLDKLPEIEKITYQYHLDVNDNLFGQEEFHKVMHTYEYQDIVNFVRKIDSRLMGNKEKFSVSEPYKEVFKKIFAYAPEYQDFREGKKKDTYPVFFNQLRKLRRTYLLDENSDEESEEETEE